MSHHYFPGLNWWEGWLNVIGNVGPWGGCQDDLPLHCRGVVREGCERNLRFVRRAVCAECACDDLGYISGENMDGFSVFVACLSRWVFSFGRGEWRGEVPVFSVRLWKDACGNCIVLKLCLSPNKNMTKAHVAGKAGTWATRLVTTSLFCLCSWGLFVSFDCNPVETWGAEVD